MRHTPINLNAPDRSPLWYELRMKGIGASEAAAAANQDPKYSNPWFIYCLKTGEIEEQQETRAMRLGKEVEPIIAREYTIETGIKIEQCPLGMYRHPTHDFMFCSPDAAVSWENGIGGEFKMLHPDYARFLNVKKGDPLPESCVRYHCQAQWILEVMGWVSIDFTILIGNDIMVFTVERNERMISALVAHGRRLWKKIQDRTPPEVDWSQPASMDVVKQMYREVDESRVEATEDQFELVTRDRELRDRKRDIDTERSGIKAELLAAIGKSGGLTLPDGKEWRRKLMPESSRRASVVKEHIKLMPDCNQL